MTPGGFGIGAETRDGPKVSGGSLRKTIAERASVCRQTFANRAPDPARAPDAEPRPSSLPRAVTTVDAVRLSSKRPPTNQVRRAVRSSSSKVETAGIEPASAVAQEVASTSVSGALISSPTRHAGGVMGDQLRKVVLGVGRSGPSQASLLVDPGNSAAGELEARSAHGLVTKRRARTRESPHLLFSRVFYEASRDLDSQPPPRTDHVEACRPRGLCLQIQYTTGATADCGRLPWIRRG
jgi:hypothetical protein